MHTGAEYADKARDPKYDKLTYAQADCQAFCEIVLRDIGVRDSRGRPYNWRGSNYIARNACSWIGTVDECIRQYGEIPRGAWAFIWDNSGKERERGYYDGLGNYAHIGIYVGNGIVRDSTRYKDSTGTYVRDGVGDRSVKAFNRIGLASCLDFSLSPDYDIYNACVTDIENIRNTLNTLEKRLEVLKK